MHGPYWFTCEFVIPTPLMQDSCSQDEGVIFMYQAFPKPLPEKEFTDFVNLIFGANASTVSPSTKKDPPKLSPGVVYYNRYWICIQFQNT